MAVIDDIPADLLPVLLPVGIVVLFVILTVVIVFWLGSNRQRSFEEAKAQASKQAEEVLREKEHQNSPRAANKKGRRPRRPKKSDQGEDSQEESLLVKDEGQPRKSILKMPVPAAPLKEATPERSPRSKVGFQLDTPPKEDNKTPRMSPPTPHPNKQQTLSSFTAQPQRTVQPLFEEPEEEENSSAAMSGAMVAVKTKKPHPQTAVGKVGPKKSRVRSKQPLQTLDSIDALPASRISDIVVSSSLSDEDIQQLMDVLLDKMNTNAEWQAASVSLRPDNVKTLKKQNQDLQDKFEEAQKTVVAHSNKIKELRAEIQNEKVRHQSSENGLQGKITAQNNDLAIARAKMSGLEEELKQMKAQSSAEMVQKLEQENALLKDQLTSVKGKADSQSASLEAHARQIQQLQDTNVTMKADLQRAKTSLTNEPKLQERVSELEGLVASMEQEKQQLEVTLQDVSRDNSKLKAEVDSLTPVREERDSLKQKATSLEADNAKFRNELDLARQVPVSPPQTNDDSVRVELERKNAEEVERVREEMSSQHRKEVQELRETISKLEGSQGDKEKELSDLRLQVGKNSSLEEQLKTVSQQLQEEKGANKALQTELDTLRSSASTGTGNGPIDVPDDSSGSEELAKAVGERDELKSQVKELEKKLEDLKTKNKSLYDSCWKAKDEAAILEKVCEEKLKAAHIETERRCKTAKTETLTKAREEQQIFLKQLFPSLKVESTEYSKWMDEFEVKVDELLKGYNDKISSLECKVEELQESEQGTSEEEAQQIRNTLETTRTILEKLQSEVTKQQKVTIEKEVMLERERTSNRNLQEQLRGEKETSASLQQQLESLQKREAETVGSSRDMESRLSEVEERLKETESERDSCKEEIGTLRSSLGQEVEAKKTAQQQAEEREKQLQKLNEQVASESQQRQTSETKCHELEDEVGQLRKKLTDSENMVEIMKNSNRELNAQINSLSPKRKAKAESEV